MRTEIQVNIARMFGADTRNTVRFLYEENGYLIAVAAPLWEIFGIVGNTAVLTFRTDKLRYIYFFQKKFAES